MRVLCVGGDIALRIHGEMLDYWQIQTEILARKFEVTDSGYSYPRPTGFLVYLCNNGGTLCSDVTNTGSGSVDFTGYGVPANQTLKLYSKVNGTGTMSPLYGASSNVTVNYSW